MGFYVLACSICGIAWVLKGLVETGLHNGFAVIAAGSPALAAVIVATICDPRPAHPLADRKRLTLFVSWAAGVLAVLCLRRYWSSLSLLSVPGRPSVASVYPSFLAAALDLVGAAAMAYVLSSVYSRARGARMLMHSLAPAYLARRWRWVLAGVAAYPGVVLLGHVTASMVGAARMPLLRVSGPWGLILVDVALSFTCTCFGGGGLEEPGWRGFMLPRLQEKRGPVLASVIIAPLWAFWHLPFFATGYMGGGAGALGVLAFSIGTVPMSFVLTALFNASGSLLPATIALHSAFNITGMYLEVPPIASVIWLVIGLLLAVVLWRSPARLAHAPREEKGRIGAVSER